ncbi:MAG: glyoxalase [Timaviella obliquedivisa GSE-PSE-MK23-08B]|nr:glyoxalase [Timaviella obliquedivisa GSE-PSE-MK23-08B]
MVLHTKDIFVTLVDADGETLVRFYRLLFGQEPSVHIPKVYTEFRLPGLRLGLFKPQKNQAAEFSGRPSRYLQSSAGGMSLCVEVDDLEGAIAQFIALGCPPPGEIIVATHGREIYAYDPLGNRLILHEKLILPDNCLPG